MSISGIILAAGGSKRFGNPKLLSPWRNKTLIRHILDVAISSSLSPLIIVLGAYKEEISAEIKGLPIQICENPEWEKGQSTSMKIGLENLPQECEAAMFLLADQPFLSKSLIEHLQLVYRSSDKNSIIIPKVKETRSNPVIFPKPIFPALLAVEGDKGGRGVFQDHSLLFVPWKDEKILLDIDTLEDLKKITKLDDDQFPK